MLRVHDLVVKYGEATAVDGVSLHVGAGEMVALVGPNAAGKSSLVNAITGLVPVSAGTIRLEGRVAQVPEGRQMFADLSVEDNLRLGAWRSGSRDPRRIFELFPDLERLRTQVAGTLSGGQQQMVAIGRALMADPDLIVIDELSLGLAPLVVSDLAQHLRELNSAQGTAVLLIEQEIGLAFELCSRAYLLESGRVVLEGPTSELISSSHLRRVYLGDLEAEVPSHPDTNTGGAPQ